MNTKNQHTHILTDRQFFDLEQLLNGGFAPLKGFLNETDYESVITSNRLSDGSLWPIPITLDISDTEVVNSQVKVGDTLILEDKYSQPIARLEIESLYQPDTDAEALAVYGTNDSAHPGVHHLEFHTKDWYVGGTVTRVSHPWFEEGVDSPESLREKLSEVVAKNGSNNIIAFQTRNPIHRAHYEIIKRAAETAEAHVLIHPIIGLTKEGDIDKVTRTRVYKHIVSKFNDERGAGSATLSLLPLAMRMAGPKEALWHALIRKNYGATHFIIGRDHAGPGNDSAGKPFYGTYEAQEFVSQFTEELGINIVTSEDIAYSLDREVFVAASEITADEKVASISGTEVRRRLAHNEAIPEWFSFPEVISELRHNEYKNKHQGIALFMTGFSGSGKSTIARILSQMLEAHDAHRKISVLDGDVVRKHISDGLGFSQTDRIRNVARLGFVASEIVKHGGIVIVPAISPYESARKDNRSLIEKTGHYFDIHINTSLAECESRDIKGLYEKARSGEIGNFTGISDPYEVPENPELIITTEHETAHESAEKILHFLQAQGLVN